MSRAYRAAYEFSKETILEALRRSDFCCEECGKHKSQTPEHFLEAHHRIGIYYFVKHHREFPDITREIMRSLANCSVLCNECHTRIHAQESLQYYKTIAELVLRESKPSQLALSFIAAMAR